MGDFYGFKLKQEPTKYTISYANYTKVSGTMDAGDAFQFWCSSPRKCLASSTPSTAVRGATILWAPEEKEDGGTTAAVARPSTATTMLCGAAISYKTVG